MKTVTLIICLSNTHYKVYLPIHLQKPAILIIVVIVLVMCALPFLCLLLICAIYEYTHKLAFYEWMKTVLLICLTNPVLHGLLASSPPKTCHFDYYYDWVRNMCFAVSLSLLDLLPI